MSLFQPNEMHLKALGISLEEEKTSEKVSEQNRSLKASKNQLELESTFDVLKKKLPAQSEE